MLSTFNPVSDGIKQISLIGRADLEETLLFLLGQTGMEQMGVRVWSCAECHLGGPAVTANKKLKGGKSLAVCRTITEYLSRNLGKD